MAFFGGIGGAASRGILYKGGNVFSKVARVKTVALDKTGTITNGKFIVRKIFCFNDFSKEQVLSMASSAEYASNHPIAECIKFASDKIIPPRSVTELAGYGVMAELYENTCAVGNVRLMERLSVDLSNIQGEANGSVYVAIDGRLAGVILLTDSVKPEAKNAIATLKKLGVSRTVILSGDKEANVHRVATEIGIDEANAELSPEQKYEKLKELIAESESTMYVGDGINDSPALALADVGVAMGALGQDSAIEAADMVIMTDNLSKISEAILIARKTIQISRQNIIFALGSKAIILLLGLLGFANMWLAVFADVGVAVLAILNSTRALRAPK